jgi:uncharacterized protein (DUF427 family)
MLVLALVSQLTLHTAPTQLTIDVKPEDVQVQVDGKKVGTGAKPIILTVKPGTHIVRLAHKGDTHEEEVPVKAGEKKTYSWTFEDAKPPASNIEDE